MVDTNVESTTIEHQMPDSSTVSQASSNKFFSSKKINVTLDDHNYLLWHQQVYLTVKTHRLLKYIDSKVQPPPHYVSQNGVDAINPEYELFEEQDGALATWLLSTVSENVLPHLIGLNTASAIWNTLHRLYSAKTTSRLMSYRRLLHSQKKGDLSMKDYLMRIKSICDNLANCGESISEYERITAILNGLPPEFDSVVTVISASPSSSDLSFVSTIPLDADARQAQLSESIIPSANVVTHKISGSTSGLTTNQSGLCADQPSVNIVQTTQDESINSVNSGYNRGRGRGRSSSRPQCQLCGRLGHLVDRCYYRYDMSFKNESSRSTQGYRGPSSSQANICSLSTYPNVSQPVYYTAPPQHFAYNAFPQLVSQTSPHVAGFPPHSVRSPNTMTSHMVSQTAQPMPTINHPQYAVPTMTSASSSASPQAFIATPEVVSDNAWYPDSGATHHITNDFNNLQSDSAYPGTGNIQVGNGNTLPIKCSGQSSLLSGSKSLSLRNLLFVPGITKNLLSVSKFTQDNSVSVEFFPKHCQVKDLATRQVLLQGCEDAGLYRLGTSPLSVNGNASSSGLKNSSTSNSVCFLSVNNSKCSVSSGKLSYSSLVLPLAPVTHATSSGHLSPPLSTSIRTPLSISTSHLTSPLTTAIHNSPTISTDHLSSPHTTAIHTPPTASTTPIPSPLTTAIHNSPTISTDHLSSPHTTAIHTPPTASTDNHHSPPLSTSIHTPPTTSTSHTSPSLSTSNHISPTTSTSHVLSPLTTAIHNSPTTSITHPSPSLSTTIHHRWRHGDCISLEMDNFFTTPTGYEEQK
ncbi:hypothetical protein GQ457_10G000020 [Hibiscus cannabinus]